MVRFVKMASTVQLPTLFSGNRVDVKDRNFFPTLYETVLSHIRMSSGVTPSQNVMIRSWLLSFGLALMAFDIHGGVGGGGEPTKEPLPSLTS